jgi:putative transposase
VDVPHHITQRGNYRQPIFFHEEDYAQYLAFIFQYARTYALEIWAYCLMPNHIHMIAVPHLETALARTFGIGHMQYTQYIHRRDRQVGHLWQGRYYSSPLDEDYLSAAVRYVEMNPVRAQLVKTPEEWPWSSAAPHLQGLRLPGASYPPDDALLTWREYLGSAEVMPEVELIRQRTSTGRPIGNEAFVAALNERFDQHLTLRPRGRPRKEPEKNVGAN